MEKYSIKKLKNLNYNNFLSEIDKNKSIDWLNLLKDYAISSELDFKLLLGIFPETDEDDLQIRDQSSLK